MERAPEFLASHGVTISPNGVRRWPHHLKAQIVAESYKPGVTVNDVAKHWDIRPNQLLSWRTETKRIQGVLARACDDEAVAFASVLMTSRTRKQQVRSSPHISTDRPGRGELEIVYGDVSLLLPGDWPVDRLAEVMEILGRRS